MIACCVATKTFSFKIKSRKEKDLPFHPWKTLTWARHPFQMRSHRCNFKNTNTHLFSKFLIWCTSSWVLMSIKILRQDHVSALPQSLMLKFPLYPHTLQDVCKKFANHCLFFPNLIFSACRNGFAVLWVLSRIIMQVSYKFDSGS